MILPVCRNVTFMDNGGTKACLTPRPPCRINSLLEGGMSSVQTALSDVPLELVFKEIPENSSQP